MTTVKARDDRFSGRRVIVTGGAGGLGSATARAFAEAGATVTTMDISGSDLDVDVASAGEVDAAVAQAFPSPGPHILVTLAGGSLGTPRGLFDASVGDIDTVIDVNLKGTLHACRAAASRMTAGAAIVTCSSIGARQPSLVTGLAYAAAKAAIGGLTRKLAAELGPAGVRANCVAPGLVLTPRLQHIVDEMPAEDYQAVLDAIALRRLPGVHEVVNPILFLASVDAGYITGVTLDVNGGRFMPA